MSPQSKPIKIKNKVALGFELWTSSTQMNSSTPIMNSSRSVSLLIEGDNFYGFNGINLGSQVGFLTLNQHGKFFV